MENNTKQPFEFKSQVSSIGETGDYDVCYEVTNGKISIFTKDECEPDEFKAIVDALNNCGSELYLDDSAQWLAHHFEQEWKASQNELTQVRAERDAFEKVLQMAFDFVTENCPDEAVKMIGIISVNFPAGHKTRLDSLSTERDVYRKAIENIRVEANSYTAVKDYAGTALAAYPSPKQQDNG